MTDEINNNIVVKDSLEQFKKDVAHYRRTIAALEGDAPIAVLCLPSSLEKILLKNGIVRVFDLIGTDLCEIKGIGRVRRELLTSRLDEFFSVRL